MNDNIAEQKKINIDASLIHSVSSISPFYGECNNSKEKKGKKKKYMNNNSHAFPSHEQDISRAFLPSLDTQYVNNAKEENSYSEDKENMTTNISTKDKKKEKKRQTYNSSSFSPLMNERTFPERRSVSSKIGKSCNLNYCESVSNSETEIKIIINEKLCSEKNCFTNCKEDTKEKDKRKELILSESQKNFGKREEHQELNQKRSSDSEKENPEQQENIENELILGISESNTYNTEQYNHNSEKNRNQFMNEIQEDRKRKFSFSENNNNEIYFAKIPKNRKVFHYFTYYFLQNILKKISNFDFLNFSTKKKKRRNFDFSFFPPNQSFLNLPNVAESHFGECRVLFASSEACGRAKNLISTRNVNSSEFRVLKDENRFSASLLSSILHATSLNESKKQNAESEARYTKSAIFDSIDSGIQINEKQEENMLNEDQKARNTVELESEIKEKEADGWLTARRRDFGHDFTIIQLSFPSRINAICIDTSNFCFDLPRKISVEVANLPGLENQILMSGCMDFRGVGTIGNSYEFLEVENFEKKIEFFLKENKTNWIEILPAISIVCDTKSTKNYFEFFGEITQKTFTHIRINLFPDGGIARIYVYGEIMADLEDEIETGEQFDLQSEEKGALIILYSNCSLGHPKNLLKRSFPKNKVDGWQTPRSEHRPYIFYKNFFDSKIYEFVIIKLAHRGIIDEIQMDCSIFEDEMPQKVSVEILDRTDIFAMEYRKQQRLFIEDKKNEEKEESNLEWKKISLIKMDFSPIMKLKLSDLENLGDELSRVATHVKLLLYPDGGVGRIKVLGRIFDPLKFL